MNCLQCFSWDRSVRTYLDQNFKTMDGTSIVYHHRRRQLQQQQQSTLPTLNHAGALLPRELNFH